MRQKIINRTVLLLGAISLFTDMASEMLYPIMPLYLESIGFTAAGIGLLEGIAQATAGLSKGYFGQLSDRMARRVPFVQLGYGLSAISKPLLAAFVYPWWVFMARTVDRLGKGIRTGARDALLSAEATPATKARVFGFHRAMDTTGAAIGPALALLFLWVYPGQYRLLFIVAIVPGVVAILATLLLKEKSLPAIKSARPGLLDFMRYLPGTPRTYRRLIIGLLGFALINSSDLFLLLLLKAEGLSDTALIGWYIFYNLIYALVAYPAGMLADGWGLKPTFLLGLGLFALVYGGLPFAGAWWTYGVLFLLYGCYAACTESIAKAWISTLVPEREMGTAIGAYSALESVAALLASAGAGLIWYLYGPQVLFGTTAVLALLIIAYFLMLPTGGFATTAETADRHSPPAAAP